MVEENLLVNPFFLTTMVLLITSIILIYRVIFGPTAPDRIVGFNTISTKVVVVISLIAVINEEYVLIDLSIVLLMMNTVGGLILAKHFERGGSEDGS
ncbi:MAG: monovalent cation/H+ antiporter complex subunit F [Candidatus Natronoplasma sp.]